MRLRGYVARLFGRHSTSGHRADTQGPQRRRSPIPSFRRKRTPRGVMWTIYTDDPSRAAEMIILLSRARRIPK